MIELLEKTSALKYKLDCLELKMAAIENGLKNVQKQANKKRSKAPAVAKCRINFSLPAHTAYQPRKG